MIKFRHPKTRGHLNPGWIETFRTFSNNSYLDPRYMNYGKLEVINDDTMQPKNFVPIHEHKNMEILGYVVTGPCYHNDNLRNQVLVPSGSVQRMSSGSGIWHTEGNMSDHPIHYLQIWMQPNVKDTPAEYTVLNFTREQKLNNFFTIASSAGPIKIKSDVVVSAGIFTRDFIHTLDNSRRYYVYVITGTATINGIFADTGSGFNFEYENTVEITDPSDSEILLFSVD